MLNVERRMLNVEQTADAQRGTNNRCSTWNKQLMLNVEQTTDAQRGTNNWCSTWNKQLMLNMEQTTDVQRGTNNWCSTWNKQVMLNMEQTTDAQRGMLNKEWEIICFFSNADRKLESQLQKLVKIVDFESGKFEVLRMLFLTNLIL